MTKEFSKHNNISAILKEAREKYNMTQEQLALKVGKKRSYIARVESHGGSNIKFQTLQTIIEKGFDGKVKIKIEV